jgi:outer membrane immunogenic protein
MQKSAALAGLAALTLLDISAATPAAAQGASPFQGFYAGAHAGYFTGDANFKSAPYTFPLGGDTFSIPGRNDSFDFDGFIGGAHGGVNFATLGNFLFGVEGDWTWLGDKDSVSASGAGVGIGGDGFTFQRRSEIELEWQGTVRGRIGVVNGNTLFFATAGVAFLNADWSETGLFTNTDSGISVTANHSDSDTLVGGVVGGGIEIAVTPTIIVGADYLYENFGSSDSLPHGFAAGQTGKIDDLEIHKVRARVSIKFGGPPQ